MVEHLTAGQPANRSETLLSVQNLSKQFPIREGFVKKYVRAVKNVSFELKKGETLAIVGESGSGKSTLARMITRLIEPTSGEVWLENKNLIHLSKSDLRKTRKNIQIVFQDPYASLNPRQRIKDIIADSLKIHHLVSSKRELVKKVVELLDMVKLQAKIGAKYPHELSGGQRQRIAFARALAVSPKLIIFDEAVSALDVSIQAQMLNLIGDLQKQLQLSYLFITHDLSVARHVATHVAVMYSGEFVEYAEADQLFSHPHSSYTKTLLFSIPLIGGKWKAPQTIGKYGSFNPIDLSSGFPFNPVAQSSKHL